MYRTSIEKQQLLVKILIWDYLFSFNYQFKNFFILNLILYMNRFEWGMNKHFQKNTTLVLFLSLLFLILARHWYEYLYELLYTSVWKPVETNLSFRRASVRSIRNWFSRYGIFRSQDFPLLRSKRNEEVCLWW